MLTVGCISFSFFSPLAMPPLHKTVCSGASLVTGEYTEVAFMRVWTPIYVYPELYILFLFSYYFLFLFFVSLSTFLFLEFEFGASLYFFALLDT